MLRKILGGLADFYIAVVAVWAVAWKLTRDRWGIMGLANAWGFWLLITALPVGALRMGRRSRWGAAGWVAAGLALLAGRYTFSLPRATVRAAGGGADDGEHVDLRFMSFNLLKENTNSDAAIALIQRESPDVVVLQELEPDMQAALEQGFAATHPYHHYAPHPAPGRGLGVFARTPFEVSGYLVSDSRRPFALRVTLNLTGTSLDVYDVHLLPTAGKTLLQMGPTANFRLRTQQAQRLVDEISQSERPALAMGDYNLTEASEGYRVLRSGLNDAWRIAGKGMGWSWPRWLAPHLDMVALPIFRIDYCFCNDAVRPWQMRVLRDLTGSDHCPLVVDARIPLSPGSQAVESDWPVRRPAAQPAYAGKSGLDTL